MDFRERNVPVNIELQKNCGLMVSGHIYVMCIIIDLLDRSIIIQTKH